MRIKLNDEIKTITADQTIVVTNSEIIEGFEPTIGSIHDLQSAARVNFSWPRALVKSEILNLEFSRESSFETVLFTEDGSNKSSLAVDFSDRSTGPWFARLRSAGTTHAVTSFNLVESQTPDRLRRLGRRWLTWRDRGLAAIYRVEFSQDEAFQKINHSIQDRNRELDLARVQTGKYFARVVSVTVNDSEFASRPIALDVPDKSEILYATLELSDPELKLEARGWKILLTHDEVTRIREGYVILRESELRGIKVPDSERENVIFELSRDETFSNP
jgi:hypothetical protein